jgi:Fe-S-cluster containining protein
VPDAVREPITAASRQQRRALERARKREIDVILRDGISYKPGIDETAILARHLIGVLKAENDLGRASRAAEIAERVFEISLRRDPGPQAVACTLGCAYCCTNFVAATIPEILALAARIRQDWPQAEAPIRQRIVDFVPGDFVSADRTSLKMPCPVLSTEGSCEAYGSRPLVCRGFASISVDACIRSLTDSSVAIPTTKHRVHYRTCCTMALWAALKASGFSNASYDMQHALSFALAHDDAERGWLAGEDIFVSVQSDASRNPEFAIVVDRVIERALS